MSGLQLSSAQPGKAGGAVTKASITLIARRSVHRAGTRHWRRGADTDGAFWVVVTGGGAERTPRV